MKMPEPLLSPSEIAATIYDSGHVRDRGSAERLEQRILAYAAAKAAEAQTQGLVQAARRAHSALAGIRSGSQRTAAARIVRAIESLLPADAKTKEAYALGYKDGTEDAVKKSNRDDITPRTR
jgi:hypothetical protein